MANFLVVTAPDFGRALAKVRALRASSRRGFSRTLRKLGGFAKTEIAANFLNEGRNLRVAGAPWKPLAQATVENREALGFGGPHLILTRTSDLAEGTQVLVSGNSLTLMNRKRQARAQHKGNPRSGRPPGVRLPARPHLILSGRARDRVRHDIIETVNEERER